MAEVNEFGMISMLGWDIDEFDKDLAQADVPTIERAIKILEQPDPPGTPDYSVHRSEWGLRRCRQELESRKRG